MDSFFERLTQLIESKKGLIVTFIGDAALIVFEENLAEQGILSLLNAKTDIDDWLQSEGYPSLGSEDPLRTRHSGSVWRKD